MLRRQTFSLCWLYVMFYLFVCFIPYIGTHHRWEIVSPPASLGMYVIKISTPKRAPVNPLNGKCLCWFSGLLEISAELPAAD